MQAVVVVEQALEIRQVVQAQMAAAAGLVAANLELLFRLQETVLLVRPIPAAAAVV
jgi:hypothetical protein